MHLKFNGLFKIESQAQLTCDDGYSLDITVPAPLKNVYATTSVATCADDGGAMRWLVGGNGATTVSCRREY